MMDKGGFYINLLPSHSNRGFQSIGRAMKSFLPISGRSALIKVGAGGNWNDQYSRHSKINVMKDDNGLKYTAFGPSIFETPGFDPVGDKMEAKVSGTALCLLILSQFQRDIGHGESWDFTSS